MTKILGWRYAESQDFLRIKRVCDFWSRKRLCIKRADALAPADRALLMQAKEDRADSCLFEEARGAPAASE
ncbi:hypothetical protein C0674_04165 [Sporolactobacillus terrae]|uniref:Uncharacterized protein n=1 Tax=Sporolactobacillus terrae TaxID=269673 RepID=A0ABX5Q5E7_9BACL|nr:hypothetical protein C0674_04165 [Sporolactobacillus terrae]QAA24846.1 hypothetical protein C0679_04140 [Sporolactobacillus terrae]